MWCARWLVVSCYSRMWWLTLSRPDLPRVNPLDGPRPALNTRSMISIEIGLGVHLHFEQPFSGSGRMAGNRRVFLWNTKYELQGFLLLWEQLTMTILPSGLTVSNEWLRQGFLPCGFWDKKGFKTWISSDWICCYYVAFSSIGCSVASWNNSTFLVIFSRQITWKQGCN